MTKPADLKPGDQIDADGIGVLTVVQVFMAIEDGDRDEVDVEPDAGADIWDMAPFAESARAEDAQWLANTPRRLYRLHFDPAANVTLIEAGPVPQEAR